MKKIYSTAATITGLALMIGVVYAQQGGQQQDQPSQQPRQNESQKRSSQQTDKVKSVVRASEIIGMNVKNNQDEDLGEIEDLAIDQKTGKIEYAAVSIGGVLGIGDKLIAVPWNAIECREEPGSESRVGGEPEKVAILDLDKEAVKNVKGFDEENWPDMANQRWKQENDRQYQSRRRTDETR